MPEMQFILAMAVASVWAAEPGPWRVLLNKSDFGGWSSPTGHTNPAGAWEIRNGVLTTQPYVQRRTDLWSDEVYENFELEWEWKAGKGANSGIKYWVQDALTLVVEKEDEKFRRIEDPRKAGPGETTAEYSRGLEYQMTDDANEPVSIERKDARAGGLYSLFAPDPETVKGHGKWNRSRLLVRNGRFEHWLNGRRVLEFDLAQLEQRMTATKQSYRLERRRGPIALQYHQTVVSFRHMRIRRW